MIKTFYQHQVIKWCMGWLQLLVVHYHQLTVEVNIPAGWTWYSFFSNRLCAHLLGVSSLSSMGMYICFESTSYQFQLQFTQFQKITSSYAPDVPSMLHLYITWLTLTYQSVGIKHTCGVKFWIFLHPLVGVWLVPPIPSLFCGELKSSITPDIKPWCN